MNLKEKVEPVFVFDCCDFYFSSHIFLAHQVLFMDICVVKNGTGAIIKLLWNKNDS